MHPTNFESPFVSYFYDFCRHADEIIRQTNESSFKIDKKAQIPGQLRSLSRVFEDEDDGSSTLTSVSELSEDLIPSGRTSELFEAAELPDGRIDGNRLKELLREQRNQLKERIKIEQAKREALAEILLSLTKKKQKKSKNSEKNSGVCENRRKSHESLRKLEFNEDLTSKNSKQNLFVNCIPSHETPVIRSTASLQDLSNSHHVYVEIQK